MPTAPPECTHDKSECRIVVISTRSLTAAKPLVYDGNGDIIQDNEQSVTVQDCLCNTCGLQWSVEPGLGTPVRGAKFHNVRQTGTG